MVELRRFTPWAEARFARLPAVRGVLVLCAVLLLLARTGWADSESSPPSLSFSLAPAVAFPLGPGASYFLPGVAARAGAEYTLPTLPMLSVRAGILYGFAPIVSGLGTTSLAGGVVGATWRVPVAGRLSAQAFAGAGYAVGVVNGDASSSGSMPLLEGGMGLSWLVSPRAALRLDGSYLYFVGANGSLAVSLGVVLRPWSNPDRPVVEGRQKTSLRIEGVALDTVYPSLRRFYDNNPVGKALIRNAGRRSVFDLRVRYRVPGVMEKPRESAVRRELKAGETWEAPLDIAFDSLAPGPDTAASMESEVAVTFVEGGEEWELRRTVSLDIQASHLIGADDLGGAAAFVLPSDPALRELADLVAKAIGGPGGEGGGKPVRAAFAVREALRLTGVRVVPDSAVAPARDAKGNALRTLKYPRETLRDRAGNSGDIAVLCASLLEAAGVRAALVEASGRMFVAVEPEVSAEPEAAEARRPEDRSAPAAAGGDPLIVLEGRTWMPVDAAPLDGTFRKASAAALRAWNAASGPGGRHLVAVRDAWSQYPPSALPPEDPQNRVLVRDELGTTLESAVAAFSAGGGPGGTGDAPVSAVVAAKPPARRLLVVFSADPPDAYPVLLRATLADSLALALGFAAPGVLLIPYGPEIFPASAEERRKVARDRGADCFVVVGASGDKSVPVITAETGDLLAAGGTRTAARIGPISLVDASRPDWGPVVSMVVGAFVR